jgi:chromosome transmission fidelity protein 18
VSTLGAPAPVRYAVRQVLDQEHQKNLLVRANAARQARYKAGAHPDLDGNDNDNDSDSAPLPTTASSNLKCPHQEPIIPTIKKDFFGRVVKDGFASFSVGGDSSSSGGGDANASKKNKKKNPVGKDENKVWVSFHEGFSNAVRKPVTVEEILRGL